MELAVVPRDAFAYSWSQTRKKLIAVIEIYNTTPESSREVSEKDEFIDKVKQNILFIQS